MQKWGQLVGFLSFPCNCPFKLQNMSMIHLFFLPSYLHSLPQMHFLAISSKYFLPFPLLPLLTIISSSSSSAMGDRSQPQHKVVVPGGWTDQDVNSTTIRDLASRSVSKISTESNDIFHLMPVQIESARSQVVAGVQYELRIVVGRSTGKKNQGSTAEGANYFEGDQKSRKTYEVNIWQKPWLNFEEITYKPAN